MQIEHAALLKICPRVLFYSPLIHHLSFLEMPDRSAVELTLFSKSPIRHVKES
jgi:hypothetical protein